MREEWTKHTLGELCTIVKGASPTMKTAPGQYPLIVTAAEPLSSSEYQFDGEAVCIPMVSSTGHGHASLKRVHYASGKFAVANIIAAVQVRDSTQASTKFLALYLQHFKDELIVSRMRGTANVSLSLGVLKTVPVELPPLHEQLRIVDLIGALDINLEAASAAIGTTRAAAVELRRVAFEALASDYSMDSAGEMFDVLLGRQKSARQSIGDHVIPYMRAGNLSDGSLSLAVVQTMNFDPREQEKYCLKEGDVLIAEGGSVGQSAVWNGEVAGPVGFDKHVLRVRGVAGRSVGAYAFQWARWSFESGQFAAAATGITIKALGFDRAKRIPVPAVPVAQQLETVQHLTAVDQCAAAAAELADSLRATRAELLSVLLSGEHMIPESYDVGTAVQLDPAA